MNEQRNSISAVDFEQLKSWYYNLNNEARSSIGSIHGFTKLLLEEKELAVSDREDSLRIILREIVKLENNFDIFSIYFGMFFSETMESEILSLQDTVTSVNYCENVKLSMPEKDISVRCNKFYFPLALRFLTNPYSQDSYNASVIIKEEDSTRVLFLIDADLSIDKKGLLYKYSFITANKIIEEHDSNLEVSSKEDKTTFKFTLPIVESDSTND